MMQNNEKTKSTNTKSLQTRWFILALGFFVLNAWAVLRDKPTDDRDTSGKATRTATGGALVQVSPAIDTPLKERAEIRWSFSTLVVAEIETHIWGDTGPFAFTPPQDGMFCWESPKDLVFKPQRKWQIAQNIRATPAKTLRDLQGRKIQLPDSYFNTAHLRMLGVDFNEKLDQVRFRFNAEIHPGQLAKHLTIRADSGGEALVIKATSTEPTKSPILTIAKNTAHKLHLEISPNLRPAHGDIGLKEPVKHTLSNPGSLYLRDTTPKMYSFGKGDIYLKFSRNILPGKLQGHLEIQPELPFRILSSDSWWRGHCRIHADFKPSTSYRLIFHKGIQPVKGLPNAVHFARSIQMPARPADVTFLHRGSHLSPHGNLQLPIHSVNLDQVRVSISRIYPNNLVIFGMRNADKYDGYYGRAHKGLSLPVVKEQRLPILEQPDQTVETHLDLRRLLEPPYAGIYHVDIQGERSSQADRKILHITDIGISLQRSEKEILVWANSLTTLEPTQNAAVTFYSEGNQILATGHTNAQGLAQIHIPDNHAEVPFLLTVESGQDLGSLFLGETTVDSPDAQDGRPYLGEKTEAYVFPDRGIYRPGETTHIKAIVRNARAHINKPFPVELQVRRPDGREGRRFHGMLSQNGTVNFDIQWPRTNPLGKYTFQLKIPGSTNQILGVCQTNLEEFTAAKLEVQVHTDKSSAKPDESLEFEVSARHLFGRPADDLKVTTHIRYLPKTFQHPDWADFNFQDYEKTFPAEHAQLKKVAMGQLDTEGLATFSTEIVNIQPPSSSEILLIATVADVAGRPVSGSVNCEVHPYPFHVGIRQCDEPKTWETAAITPDGKPAPNGTELLFSIHHVTRTLLLRKDDDGNYRYQSERHLTEIQKFTVQTQGGRATYTVQDTPSSGTYIVSAKHPEGGSSASIEWKVQSPKGHTQAWSSEEPEKIELTFDQADYILGQTATLDIVAPFPGKALITLQQDTILEFHVMELGTNGTGQISFDSSKEYFPNAWATVSVIRKVVPGEPHWKPHRAFGRTSLKLSSGSKRLLVQIETPEQVRPTDSFATTFRITTVDGEPADAELTLALVDEGVLSLTAFSTPNPLDYFHTDRRPEFHLHDPYGLLLPETEGPLIRQKLAVGSGGNPALAPALGKFLNPFTVKRFKNLALWKPSVQTDADGQAEVRWDLPEFSGKVRLMAIAVAGDQFGSAQEHVIVKRPFTVASGLPRFLAPGDQFTMPIRLYNDSEENTEFDLRVRTSENLSVEGPSLKKHGYVAGKEYFETTVPIKTSDHPGTAWVEITATALGESYSERIELAIRPSYARESKVHAGVLSEGEHLDIPPSKGFLASTTSGHLETSPVPDALLGPALEYLLRYPYGCLEQTTSGSLPLLYVQDMAVRTNPDLLQPDEVHDYVQAGIRRVLSMQNSQGAFGWWPGASEPYHWGTVYATQFLLEAKGAGFNVPGKDLERALAWIQKKLNASTSKVPQDIKVHSLQVLAQAGKLPPGWLQRFWEQREKLSHESSIRLAMAHIHSGDRRKASELAKDLIIPTPPKNKLQSWDTLSSPLRTRALLLGLHVELDPGSARTVKLAAKLQSALEDPNYWTTQENAMLLLAMGKYARHLGNKSLATSALIVIDGDPMGKEDARQHFHFLEGKLPGMIQLKNQGPGPLYYSLTLDGIPETPPISRAEGIRISRNLLDEEGVPIGKRPIQRGEILRVELSIDTFGIALDHLAIRDLLPAGLEIETSKPDTSIRHKEHRDDRFLVFPNAIRGTKKFHYLARAVTAGSFTLPAPTATCMYDAEIQAIGRLGTLTILD